MTPAPLYRLMCVPNYGYPDCHTFESAGTEKTWAEARAMWPRNLTEYHRYVLVQA